MSAVVDIAFPVFAIILAGYLGGRARLLGRSSSDALNQFVYWFALPPVVFLGMARSPLAEIVNLPFLGVFIGSMLVIYGLGVALGWRRRPDGGAIASMQGLNACFSNTGYMGIPLFLAAFGPDRIAPAVLATVVMSAVMVGLAVIVLESLRNDGHGVGRTAANVVTALGRNPLVVAPLIGVLVSVLGIPLPKAVISFGELLGAAAGPCALFAIGLFLAGQPLAVDIGEVGRIVLLKLILQPLLAWALATYVFVLDPFWTASAVILAALPTGALTFVVAQRYDIYVERTSTVILISTLLSALTLSVLLVHYAGPIPGTP